MSWSLEQITAVATVAGVFGGLISVYFLVHEVRRNAQAIEGATVQSLMSFEKDVFLMLGANAKLYLRGRADASKLSADDKYKFDKLVVAQMSLFYSAFVQFEQKLIDDEVWVAYHNALKRDLAAPGFLASWQATETTYPKSFRQMIEKG